MPRQGDPGVPGADVEGRLGPRLIARLDERHALLERLSRIQRSISVGAPLQEVLDAITAGAAELLEEDVIGLRLLDPDSPGRVYIASSVGLSDEEKLTVRESAIGEGAGGRAILEDALVVLEDYATAAGTIPHFAREGLQAAMAAPVHDGATVVGSLVVASYEQGRRYSESEREMLMAFAEHASLAIADARMIAERERLAGRHAEADRARLQERLQRAQALESIGTLAAQVAHDFNNLLGVILNFSRFALGSLDAAHPARREVQRIEEAAEHGSALTSQLLEFSRRGAGASEVVLAGEIVSTAVALAEGAVPEGVTVRTEPGAAAVNVRIDPTELRQVVLNLLDNAFDATPAGGKVTVVVSERAVAPDPARPHLRAGRYASLIVRDTGCGMEPEIAARALEPMFTTKPRGKGTGFGLAIVGRIAEDAGGAVELRTTPGRGTEVEVLFPLAGDPVVATPGRGETILLVEDDDGVRELTRRLLCDEGFTVVEANGAERALALDAERAGPFDLVITDNAMPGMPGIELLRALRCVAAGTPAIVMSGFVAEPSAPVAGDPAITWLQKPFGASGLLGAVRGALGAAHGTARRDDRT